MDGGTARTPILAGQPINRMTYSMACPACMPNIGQKMAGRCRCLATPAKTLGNVARLSGTGSVDAVVALRSDDYWTPLNAARQQERDAGLIRLLVVL